MGRDGPGPFIALGRYPPPFSMVRETGPPLSGESRPSTLGWPSRRRVLVCAGRDACSGFVDRNSGERPTCLRRTWIGRGMRRAVGVVGRGEQQGRWRW